MAAVYKGEDLVLGRHVAVKVLHTGLIGDEIFLAKFKREAHAVANLQHPNIVTVHDVGEDGENYFIVMELVEGSNLKQIIREQKGNPLKVNRALNFALKICQGLGYAHRAGLVHCDMKPQNILVTRDERVKITDFGIARAMSEATSQVADQVWGTPQYFSPEQARGLSATPSSDVYSVGIILYEMLTGELPFSAETHTAIALKHIQESPPPIHLVNPSVSPDLELIVNKVLSKEPTARYRTAGQFGRILDSYRVRHSEETDTSTYRAKSTKPASRPVVPANPDTSPLTQPLTSVPAPITVPEPKLEPTLAPITPTPKIAEEPEPAVYKAPVVRPISTQKSAEPVTTSTSSTDPTILGLGLFTSLALLGLLILWIMVARAWGVF